MLQVYSKSNCPNCDKTKMLLKNKGIEFEVVNIEEDQDAREWLLDQGHRAVPQLYLDGKLFVEGGYSGLAKLTDFQLRERLGEIGVSN